MQPTQDDRDLPLQTRSNPENPQWTALQRHFDVLHGILGIFLTNKCNVTCRHCATNSGPLETGLSPLDRVIPLLEPAVKAGIVRGIHVNGGEPFLYQRDIRRIAAEGRRLGILVGVNTNGFWAKTLAEGMRTIESMPGLTQLMLSTDVYHEEFIPLSAVKNAAEAGVRLGLVVQIAVCTPAGKPGPFTERLLDALGEDLLRDVAVGVNPIESEGRALVLPEAQWRPLASALPSGRCVLINRPVILDDGRIVACCNTCVSGRLSGGPLVLGDIERTTIESAYHCADSSYIVQAIRARGPEFLGDILIEVGEGGALNGPYRDGDICSLCYDIMSQPRLVQILERAMLESTRRKAVAVARAAHFDELEMLFAEAGPRQRSILTDEE
jgi:hypothetical protein